jgi:hypothetical protein
MQLAGCADYLEAPGRGRLAGSLGRLGQSGANPYPNGVSVAGTGSSAPWRTGFYTPAGVWVANTGFGVAPIYSDADFARIWDDSTIVGSVFGAAGADTIGPSLVGPAGANHKTTLLAGTFNDAGQSIYSPGDSVVIATSATGWQRIDYRKDPATGLWIPGAAQGGTAGGASFFDHLIEIGAIIGATIATAGTATGFATGPGPGATAIGGSADVAAGSAVTAVAPAAAVAPAVTQAPAATADVASTTAPEIATFAPPAIAPPAVVDVSASVPIDISSATTTAAAVATNPLSQVFSISKYIQTLAGAYKTVAGLSSPGSHPQAGQTVRLPDGSIQRVNADGSATITEPSGNQTTVGAGGSVATSAPGAGAGWVVAALLGAVALFTS